MRLEFQILIAVAIDLLVGDPRWLPHPVRAIGRLATVLESAAGRLPGPTRWAGALTAAAVYAIVGLATFGAIQAAALAHPCCADVASIVCIYWTIAARDLAAHGFAVFRPLVAGDLESARRRVGALVGRDTHSLDEQGIARAAVESIAESTVDGVTAPLFFAVVAGPVGAMVYRAVNTLDSMFGHRDDRYREFGWAAARIDDLANYVPARLTAPLMCAAAWLLRLRAGDAWRVLRRDGRRHESPNSGLTEAAAAGALGVQLGGASHYDGLPLEKPTLGDPLVPPAARHIRQAIALMMATAGLVLAAMLSARIATFEWWHAWRTSG